MGAGEWTIPRAPLGLRADLMYSRIHHTALDHVHQYGNEPWYGGTASLLYYIGTPILPLRFYVLAGVGYITSNGTKFSPTVVGGTGLSLGAGRVKVFVEGRFMPFDDYRFGRINFFPVTTGLSFGTP